MTESRTRGRMRLLAGLVVFMFAALTTRLWFLQVLAADQFQSLADQNQVRVVPIQPLRGQILDRQGVVLVDNRPSTQVLVNPRGMGAREEEVLYRLSNLLHVPVEQLVERLQSRKYLPYQPIPVIDDVPKEAVFYISEHQRLFPGVSYELAAVREYPAGDTSAHALGYIGEISQEQLDDPDYKGRYEPGDVVGKAGVEAAYERYLHGTPGKREIQVNAKGDVLNGDFNRIPPTAGDNLVLSIDSRIQTLSERSLALGIELARHTVDEHSGRFLGATGGAVIVMDPRNGQVLAMASNPSYDPSIFLNGLTNAEAESLDICVKTPCQPLSHNLPLFDRAIQGLYPAGSTFKPFVALAAMREGFAAQSGAYNCPADYTAPGDTSGTVFHNWNPVSIGYISLPQALAISCDTVFYQFGWSYWVRYYRAGKTPQAELMQRDLRDFGFGRPTGIDLPGEKEGVVPTEKYKEKLYKSAPKVYGHYYGWLPGDYINMSIGQGFLLVTPMQLAEAYSAVANGGTLFAPHLGLRVQAPDGKVVKKISPKVLGRLPIAKKDILFIKNSLTGVTASGTASTAFEGFPLDQYPIAGKTGTADIGSRQPYSWFAAIAPADHPRYVVVAMVEQGGHGSTTAAPLVRRILEGLFGLQPPRHLQAGNTVD